MALEANQNCDLLDISEIIEVLKKSTISEKAESIDPNKLKCIATECLQAFVKYNWFCSHCQYPHLSPELIELLNENFPDPLNYLSPHDKYIPAFSRLKYTNLLCYATSLLHHFKPEESLEDCLWTIRILIIKQMIIQESCNATYLLLEKNIAILERHVENLEEKKTVILSYSLVAQVYLWYGYVQTAYQFIDKAIDLSNLNIGLEGKLGKRTKYQRESKSLLNVSITRKSNGEEAGPCNLNETSTVSSVMSSVVSSIAGCSSTNGNSNSVLSNFLPKNVKLMDDTLLTKVKFDDEFGLSSAIVLREEEETIVSAYISYLMQSTGSDNNLVQEEVLAYLDYLIEHSTVWSVNFKSLYLRSLLERSRSRKLERGMMQLEELVNSTKNESCAGCSWKLHLFYPILTEPIWKIEKVLADTLFSMGCVKTALDFYKDLDLWEEMVNCYCRLDQKGKAELIVRQQLEIQVTPYLLNILGDVTNDKDCYIKAWELSSHKSSRSQKSLGDWHFFRKEYAEAIPYYVKSLDINSIVYPAWSRLAYAALATGDYPLCARAYRRVLEFESDNFEAWNNLSNAYIKMGDKRRAFRTLHESLKCSYDEWRIWENFLLVAIDIGAFDEVITAWHRLIDIKGKHEDDQVIEILANSIIADIDYKEGETTSKLIKKMLQLLGRIVATSPGTARIWKVYAKLLISNNEPVDKIVNCLSKSHQCCMRQINWEKDSSKTLEILENAKDLSDYYINVFETCDDPDARQQFLSSFRLSLRSLLSIVGKNAHYWNTSENSSAIEKLFNSLKQQHETICAKLDLEI